MDVFMGSWETIKAENFDTYMDALGVGDELRRFGSVIKPVVTISQEDDHVVMKTDTIVRELEIRFRLGEEFIEETVDGRICKSVVNLEGEKLIHVKKWDEKETTMVREIRDGNLIATATFGDVTAVITYAKL